MQEAKKYGNAKPD